MKAVIPQDSVLSPLLFLLYMNTIDQHFSKDFKVACYAEDIVVWHTHTNLENSQTALNACMQGIQTRSKQLKFTINPDKTYLCILSTDRKIEAPSILSSRSLARK
ncbi:hypothetical protein TNIN_445701 [Trichonephila inaurata madagascariensis]|uniref:Reverse transcriptase domain-containing protein n=1 Tax=Trichonephila inaurata madagascariensis TaxID=2747483 RepID=A0A8X7C4K8_9ARAC|nr:hypothetical protein TNIN_445701 [Trichonephila inaurata madagascariensis]